MFLLIVVYKSQAEVFCHDLRGSYMAGHYVYTLFILYMSV